MATNDKCKITLDNPKNTYFSGSTVRGSISLLCPNKGKKIRGIYVKIIGYGKCGWTKINQERSPAQQSLPNTGNALSPADNRVEYTVQFSGSEDYMNDTFYLVGSKNGPSFQIPIGTNTYEFNCYLKPNLPSSFKGTYGKVKYKLEFVVERPWKFDEKYEMPLIVRHSLDLNTDPFTSRPTQKQTTRNVGLFGSGPISLHVFTPHSGCVAGGRLPLQVICSNNSSTHVDKVKFTLLQTIEYHSTTPAGFMHTECTRVLRKVAGGVDKKSEQKYEHILELPDDLPATRTGDGIINVNYSIQVEAKVSGLYKNLVEIIPLKIGTIPLHDSSYAVSANASGGSSVVAPPYPSLEQANQTMPVVPSYVGAPPMPMPMPMLESGYSSMPTLATSFTSTSADQSSQGHQPPPNYAQNYAPSPFSRNLPENRSLRATASTAFVSTTPSAPPLEFTSPTSSTRSSVCMQQVWDTPPSYDQVFGAMSTSSTSSPGPQMTRPYLA